VPEKYKEPYVNLKEPRRTYAGMVAAMDEAIGTIIAALDQKGLRQNTLIIFSSDNGGPAPGRITSNGPLRAGKGTLYEGGTRVAAFATWEGHIKPGSVVNEALHVVDWYPTLLKLAGASADQKLPLDGKDAWPTIAEGKPSPHTEILINTTPKNGAIRVGDWKLVLNGKVAIGDGEQDGETVQPRRAKKAAAVANDEQVELFNLAEDIGEVRDLSAADPRRTRRMADLLRHELERCGAQMSIRRSDGRAVALPGGRA
jgi:arylsulfatase A-like enzyme